VVRSTQPIVIELTGFSSPARRARPNATPGFNVIALPCALIWRIETFSPRNESSYRNGSLTEAPGSFCNLLCFLVGRAPGQS
jgi:hypothetical protein